MQALVRQFAPSSPSLQAWERNPALENTNYFTRQVNTYFTVAALKHAAAAVNLGNLQKLLKN